MPSAGAGFPPHELLHLAAAAESSSEHPLGKAIIAYARATLQRQSAEGAPHPGILVSGCGCTDSGGLYDEVQALQGLKNALCCCHLRAWPCNEAQTLSLDVIDHRQVFPVKIKLGGRMQMGPAKVMSPGCAQHKTWRHWQAAG